MLRLLLVLGCGCSSLPTSTSVLTVEAPPRPIGPGDSDTTCVVVELTNDAPIAVTSIAFELVGAQRAVVYRTDEPVSSEASSCRPLAGGAPLAIATEPDDLTALPEGVALVFAPRQRLRLELEASNSTTSTLAQTAQLALELDDSGERLPVGILHVWHEAFELPPNAAARVDGYLALPHELGDTRFVGFLANTRAMGTGVQVASATSPTADRVLVHAPVVHRWAAPTTTFHEPPISSPNGFYFQCQFYNTGTRVVRSGALADEEVCGFWALYAPALDHDASFAVR